MIFIVGIASFITGATMGFILCALVSAGRDDDIWYKD